MPKSPVYVPLTSRTGAIDDACVSGGIAWLNRDFRATAGHKGSESVDTRIEFLLIKVMPFS